MGSYFLSSIWTYILLFDMIVLWVQVFGVYPTLEIVHLLYAPPLLVHECSHLVVLASLLSVLTLGVHQVCLGRLKIGFLVVLGPPNVFHQFLKMVPQYLDVLVPMLSLPQPMRINLMKIRMTSWCDGGRTVMYPQPFTLLLFSHISGDTCSAP